jgi:Rv0078B-related antitoxin
MDQKPRPNDALYLQILRSMSPQQRLLKAFDLIETARKLFRIGLRQRHPEKTESEIQEIYVQRLLKCRNSDY